METEHEKIEVKIAIMATVVPGTNKLLVVHQQIERDGWHITHAATGVAIPVLYSSRIVAIEVGQRLWGKLTPEQKAALESDEVAGVMDAFPKGIQQWLREQASMEAMA